MFECPSCKKRKLILKVNMHRTYTHGKKSKHIQNPRKLYYECHYIYSTKTKDKDERTKIINRPCGFKTVININHGEDDWIGGLNAKRKKRRL
tara:strand:- start:551 stop:826 length:276 start_codon:yes stop_codon:yes gene_type:complete